MGAHSFRNVLLQDQSSLAASEPGPGLTGLTLTGESPTLSLAGGATLTSSGAISLPGYTSIVIARARDTSGQADGQQRAGLGWRHHRRRDIGRIRGRRSLRRRPGVLEPGCGPGGSANSGWGASYGGQGNDASVPTYGSAPASGPGLGGDPRLLGGPGPRRGGAIRSTVSRAPTLDGAITADAVGGGQDLDFGTAPSGGSI